MPFKIVKTFENGESKLTAVPNSWEENGILYWPKYNGNKLKMTENSQPQKNLKKMQCKVKRSNLITWHIAKKELEKMCKKSETETDSEENFIKNVLNNRKQPTFDNIVQNCLTDDVPANIKNETLEEGSQENAVIVISETFHKDEIITNDSTTQESINAEVQPDNSLTLLLLTKMNSIEENLKTLNETLIENTKIQTENMQTIMYGISNISAQLEKVIKQCSCPVKTAQIKNDIQLITSLEELQNFEKSLDDPDVEAELKRNFLVICGKGKSRGINNAYSLVDAMFDRKFWLKCSWTGGSRSQEEKICFKVHTKIINFFFNMVHESDNTFTLIDCYNFFKNILKNSRQRDASKKLRISATKNRPKSMSKRVTAANSEQLVPGTSTQENRQEPSLPIVHVSVQDDRQ